MELIQPAILLFLPANVAANHCFVSTDGRDEVTPRPKVLPREIAPTLPIHPRHMDRAFPFDKPDHLGYRLLRRDHDQPMDMIRQQMAFLNRALLLPGQIVKHLSQMPS
jgi:hypothetical protein